MKKNEVRIGVIGLGNMGSYHAEYLQNGEIENAVLAAVCDINEKKLNKNGDSAAYFTDAEKMMKSGLIDAVLIATPHYLHPPLAEAAFENGLHVLLEKPAGVYIKHVASMNEAAQKSGKVFSMMFQQRVNPIFIKIKKLINADETPRSGENPCSGKNLRCGELGEIKRISWIITDWFRTQTYYDSGGWRATWEGEGGGVLLNQCPHNLDLWQWICGMPKRVRAFMSFGKYHNIEVEDDVTAYMEYENGATGLFVTTTGDAPGTNRFEITGDMGKLVCENGKLTLHKNKISDREFSDTSKEAFATPECEITDIEIKSDDMGYIGITQNFVNAILNGEPLIVNGFEGIKGLTLSNAFHTSAIKDKWVDLPLCPDEFLEILNEKRENSTFKKVASEKTFSLEGSH